VIQAKRLSLSRDTAKRDPELSDLGHRGKSTPDPDAISRTDNTFACCGAEPAGQSRRQSERSADDVFYIDGRPGTGRRSGPTGAQDQPRYSRPGGGRSRSNESLKRRRSACHHDCSGHDSSPIDAARPALSAVHFGSSHLRRIARMVQKNFAAGQNDQSPKARVDAYVELQQEETLHLEFKTLSSDVALNRDDRKMLAKRSVV
jgi:hypothetical protein